MLYVFNVYLTFGLFYKCGEIIPSITQIQYLHVISEYDDDDRLFAILKFSVVGSRTGSVVVGS